MNPPVTATDSEAPTIIHRGRERIPVWRACDDCRQRRVRTNPTVLPFPAHARRELTSHALVQMSPQETNAASR